uniref:Uncharacterized protein 17 n=1 Tax=Halisarca dujardinii TaxID=2583056 RepID=A0AA96MPM3_HALDU|nr:uncharacterized protein 17 [Halisarca dujardinii]
MMLFVLFAMVITTIVGLYRAKSLEKMLKVFLANLLVSVLATGLVMLVLLLLTQVLIFSSAPRDLHICRVLIWGLLSCSGVRFFSLTANSLLTLLVVVHGKKKIRKSWIFTLLASIWFVPVLIHLYILIPVVYPVFYYGNFGCFPLNEDSNGLATVRLVSSSLSIIASSVIPLIMCVVMPSVMFCYLRQNTMSAHRASYNKGLAKLALFLITGNFLNFAGLVLITIVAYASQEAAGYLLCIFWVVCLFPTPCFVYLYLKPVREAINTMLCPWRLHSGVIPVASSSSASHQQTSSISPPSNRPI